MARKQLSPYRRAHVISRTYRTLEVIHIADTIGLDFSGPKFDNLAKSYHGDILKNIICMVCGYQNRNQVLDRRCRDIKACAKRKALIDAQCS